MNLHETAQFARSLMNRHRLSDWSFGFNRRKSSMGLCRYHERRIELSAFFVQANDRDSIEDTILHEIAHALAGQRAGHGAKWQNICKQIGAVPQRCGQADMPQGRWRAVCPQCGHEYTRHRRPARGRQYCCKDCGFEEGKLKFMPRVY